MKYIINTLLVLALLVPSITQAQDVKVKDVNVSVTEENGYKKITIKKTLEDGTIDVINWEGSGEIPEEIQKELGPGGGVIIIEKEDGAKIHVSDSVKMVTKTIEVIVDENGEAVDRKENKEIKVVVRKDGEQMMKIDKDAEVIIIKEGEAKDLEGKDVKVWIEKDDANQEGKQIKVIVTGGENGAATIHSVESTDTKDLAAPKIERSLKLKDFQVSPNPADGQVNLSFKGKKAPVTIRLFDAAGRQLYKEYLGEFDGNYQNQINVETIPADLIFISVEQKGKVYTDKIALKR